LFTMEVVRAKRTFAIKFVAMEEVETDFTARQLADTLMVFTVHELDGLLLEKIKPLAVTLPYSLSDPKEYERVLRCRPSKKSELSLQFDSRYLDEPVLSANYDLQQLLLQKVNLAASKSSQGIFGNRIHQHLMSNAYLGILSLEDVAANFNVTPRSLQRRLQGEGVTFQQLSDSVRKSLALHYIQSGKHQIKEISDMLGYHELSAFSRAFKRWTGKPPVSYLS
jgi:AraC-like DNA-binding protein